MNSDPATVPVIPTSPAEVTFLGAVETARCSSARAGGLRTQPALLLWVTRVSSVAAGRTAGASCGRCRWADVGAVSGPARAVG